MGGVYKYITVLILLLLVSIYPKALGNTTTPTNDTTKNTISPDFFLKYSLGFGVPITGNFEFSNLNALIRFRNRWSIGVFGTLQILEAELDLPQVNALSLFPLKYGITGDIIVYKNNFLTSYIFGQFGNAFFLKNNTPAETYFFQQKVLNYGEIGLGTYLFVHKGDNEKSGIYIDISNQFFTQINGTYENTRKQVNLDFDLSLRTIVLRIGYKINLNALKAFDPD
jgi:hypothetical protein